MEKLFMSAGIVTTIVLCLVGILKLPFKKFKEKHPKTFKAIFTIITIVLSATFSVLDQKYILCKNLLSVDFAILICVVFAGVFYGYNGIYEGLGLKELVKKIIESIKKSKDIANHEKTIKYLNKINDIDEAITILTERKNNQSSEV